MVQDRARHQLEQGGDDTRHNSINTTGNHSAKPGAFHQKLVVLQG